MLAAGAFCMVPGVARCSQLDGRLRTIISHVPGSIGVYARLMNDAPPLFSYAADDSFPAASTIKILIMLTAFNFADRDPNALEEQVTIRRGDLVAGSPFLAGARGGEKYTVATLMKPMIQVSDNSASNALISHFGFEKINAIARRYGLRKTRLKRHFLDYAAVVHHHQNVTTPGDMGRLLFAIERGSREGVATFATPRSCRAMIDIMLGQADGEKIRAGIPTLTQVANKTGEVSGVRNDVAIVDPLGDTPFVLTVLTKHLTSDRAGVQAIQRVARAVFENVTATSPNL